MSKAGTKNRVAVYWDFENIHASLMDQLQGEGAYRRHRGQHPEVVRFRPIMAYAASLGEVVVRKAYADWHWFRSYRRVMLDTAVEPILTPTRPGAKNSADMRLLADAMDDLHRNPAITHVLILSGDGDFLPLAQRIRSSGRHVIGIGVRNCTSVHWREACNQFRDYESVAGIPALPSCTKTAMAAGHSKSASKQRWTRKPLPPKKVRAETTLSLMSGLNAWLNSLQRKIDSLFHPSGPGLSMPIKAIGQRTRKSA
jgi:uncharacterized LabA/DUF88 family protein